MAVSEQDWVPPEVDTKHANVARVYDYLVGGTHNFLADQDVGRAIIAVEPNARAIFRANRAFLGRAVRYLASAGIRQFLDVGSGIPTEGNVHEVAQRAAPDARVVYADFDPVAIAHSKAILAGNPAAAAIESDLRDPETVLAQAEATGLIDLGQPVALLLVAVVHFVHDDEDPWRLVGVLKDALAPGSYLALTHGTEEGKPHVAHAAEKLYQRGHLRPADATARRHLAPVRRLRAHRARPGHLAAVATRFTCRPAGRPRHILGRTRRGRAQA